MSPPLQARERFPREQYPENPNELREGQEYTRELPNGRTVTIRVLEVRRGNANGRGTITITEET